MATRYWVGGTGTWSDTSHWSDTSGGTGGFSVPSSSDDVYFDSNSNSTDYTVTLSSSGYSKSFRLLNPASGNLTFAGSGSISVSGDFNIGPNVIYSATGLISPTGTTTQTFTTNSQTINAPLTINSASCNVYLASSIKVAAFTLTTGKLSLNNNVFTCSSFTSTGTSYREIDFGSSGILDCTGSSGTLVDISLATITITNTPTIRYSGASASGSTRTIKVKGSSSNPANFYVTNGVPGSIVSLAPATSISYFKDLDFTGCESNITFPTSSTYRSYIRGNATFASSNGTISGHIYFSGSTTSSLNSGGKTLSTVYGDKYYPYKLYLTNDLSCDTLVVQPNIYSDTFFDMNGFDVTVATSFVYGDYVNYGNGQLSIPNSLIIKQNHTGSSTATFVFTGASSKSITNQSSETINSIVQSGSGNLIIDARKVTSISNTVAPTTITFAHSKLCDISNIDLHGTSGNFVTLTSSSGTYKAFLRKPTAWNIGTNSTDAGNNTNLTVASSSEMDYVTASFIYGDIYSGPATYNANFVAFY